MTLASAMLVTSLGLLLSGPVLWHNLVLAGLSAVIALLAWRRVGSDIALTTATLGFVFYLAGTTP